MLKYICTFIVALKFASRRPFCQADKRVEGHYNVQAQDIWPLTCCCNCLCPPFSFSGSAPVKGVLKPLAPSVGE